MKHQPAVPAWSGWRKPRPSQWSVYGKPIRRPVVTASCSASSHPGSTQQSLLRTAITGARASSMPLFHPEATPWFSSKRNTRARIPG